MVTRMENLLSTKEVAEMLGVDRKTVRRYLQSGKLVGTKIGRDYRIPQEAVNSFLHSNVTERKRAGLATVTAIANQKGGVGKTTTTVNLGDALHRMGERVLVIDLDPQASLTGSLGVNEADVGENLYHVLIAGLDPESVIRTTHLGFDLLPATIDLSAAEIELINVTLRELVLKDAIAPLLVHYDHILIDCPPSLGLLSINGLAAANQVLIPIPCEFLATRGLKLLLSHVRNVQERLNRGLQIAGILPTMYDSRTVNANEVLAELRASFKGLVFPHPVKHTVRAKEAPIAAQSMFEYDPEGDVAKTYRALAEEVLANA